jgi:acyl-ACP thioesterase
MEAAAVHAAELGVSVFDLARLKLTWVLSRYHIRLLRYPAYGETVTVRTWPSLRQGTFTLREFEARSEAGPVALATTSWLAVDLADKRPVDLDKRLGLFPLHSERALDDDFQPIPRLESGERELECPVFKSHLDFNRHVNNSIYIRWALETVPEDVLFTWSPSEIEINFRREVFYGDRILSRSQRVAGKENPVFLHEIRRIRKAEAAGAAYLRTAWDRF